MQTIFAYGLLERMRPIPQVNCDYDFGGDWEKFITPFVHNYKRQHAESDPQMDVTTGQWPRRIPGDSADGTPCYATKKALSQTLLHFHRLGILKPTITYKETICTDLGDGGRKELPVDAVLRNENGDICMLFMFYKYPFVTDWIEQLQDVKHWGTLKDLSDRLLRLKCAYVIVDDGYNSMLLGLKATLLKGVNTFDYSQSPLLCMPLDPLRPMNYFFHWWILKAMENAQKHREIIEKNVTDDWNVLDIFGN